MTYLLGESHDEKGRARLPLRSTPPRNLPDSCASGRAFGCVSWKILKIFRWPQEFYEGSFANDFELRAVEKRQVERGAYFPLERQGDQLVPDAPNFQVSVGNRAWYSGNGFKVFHFVKNQLRLLAPAGSAISARCPSRLVNVSVR